MISALKLIISISPFNLTRIISTTLHMAIPMVFLIFSLYYPIFLYAPLFIILSISISDSDCSFISLFHLFLLINLSILMLDSHLIICFRQLLSLEHCSIQLNYHIFFAILISPPLLIYHLSTDP